MRILALLVIAMVSLESLPAAARVMEPAAHATRVDRAQLEAGASGDGSVAATPRKKRPPSRKRPSRPPPDQRKRPPPRAKVNPGMLGLGAGAGAAGGAAVGALTVGFSGLILAGVFAPPTLPVIITASVVAIGVGLATPFLAALGGGGAVLIMDKRSTADDWKGLMQCAASGYCLGAGMVAGPVMGGLCSAVPCVGGLCGNSIPGLPCGNTGQAPGIDDIPGPDEPAQWTAGAAIVGLVGGSLLGGLIGWSVAPTPDDPLVPIAAGALGGAVVGAGLTAGVGAAVATAIRR